MVSGMMWERGVTMLKQYRSGSCRKSAFIVPRIRVCVIPRSWVPLQVLLCINKMTEEPALCEDVRAKLQETPVVTKEENDRPLFPLSH